MSHLSKKRPPILVVGATGAQGGAVIRALVAQNQPVRALVRDPACEAARALLAQGVSLVVGNLDDPPSLTEAVAGAYGVFSLQVHNTHDIRAETRQAGALLQAARAAGVSAFVQSSASEAKTSCDGLPAGHWALELWQNKLAIEQAVLGAGFKSAVILRPTLMMENLVAPKAHWMFPDLAHGRIVTAIGSTRPIAIVAADDIGRMAAAAFAEPARFTGASIELVGEVRTLPEIASVLSQAWDEPIGITYQLPEDLFAEGRYRPWIEIQKWINAVGYTAQPDVMLSFGLKPTSLASWAAAHRHLRLSRLQAL